MQPNRWDACFPVEVCSFAKFRAAELFESSISIPGGSGDLYDFLVRDHTKPSEIAVFVKDARKAMGLTLEAFGERFGRTKANVHGWEKGLHEPAYAVLAAISEQSGVPLPRGVQDDGDQFSPRPSAIGAELAAAFDAFKASPEVKRQLYGRLLAEIQSTAVGRRSKRGEFVHDESDQQEPPKETAAKFATASSRKQSLKRAA